MNLVYFCIILLCNYVISDDEKDLVSIIKCTWKILKKVKFQEKGRDIITKVFRIQNIKFRCKFSIFLSKNDEVSLKLSKLACWPKNKKGNVNSLELRGKRGVYVASFTINPTRLRSLDRKKPFGKY